MTRIELAAAGAALDFGDGDQPFDDRVRLPACELREERGEVDFGISLRFGDDPKLAFGGWTRAGGRRLPPEGGSKGGNELSGGGSVDPLAEPAGVLDRKSVV